MTGEELRRRLAAAEKLLTKHTRTAVLNGSPVICWEAGEKSFHYERQTANGDAVDTMTVRMDARTGEELTGWELTPEKKTGTSEESPASGSESISACAAFAEEADAASGIPTDMTPSPDGRYLLLTRDHNLCVRDRETGEERALTTDGTDGLEYGCYIDIYSRITSKRQGYIEHPLVLWSPDQIHFVTYRADMRKTKPLYLIESYADRGSELRPRLQSYPCPFVTDPDEEIPHYRLFIGNAADGTMRPAALPDFLYPVFTSPEKTTVKWLEDGSGFYTTWIARGYQEARLYLVDTADGASRTVLTETTDLFLNLGAFGLLDGYGNYQFSNVITKDRRLAFWQSERSGYAHLYRYRLPEGKDGAGEAVCEGDLFDEAHKELIVQKLIRVDETAQRIYFMANNDRDSSDPMYYQLYAVNFDGTGLMRLTPEDASHQISMGAESFVDTYSRVDLAPVTVLRSTDGSLIKQLETADISRLLALGYQIPKRITLTAGDGRTRLYGIFLPPSPDAGGEEKQDGVWPLVDYVYGGAQLYNVPRTFTWDNAMGREIFGGLQSLSRLGFAGLILDGRGVPGRGMDFHAASFHKIHDCAGLADHVYALGELKSLYPQLDLSRVGIWGNSAGGYATVSAMLLYPNTYRVGVASSGNYDQRVYEHSWTERYNGLYDETVYRFGDITRMAGNLHGKLMLAYGAMDDNVTMSQTLRLCDELNAHNKFYELLVLPRTNHNVPADPYFVRRKTEFFLRGLMGERAEELLDR